MFQLPLSIYQWHNWYSMYLEEVFHPSKFCWKPPMKVSLQDVHYLEHDKMGKHSMSIHNHHCDLSDRHEIFFQPQQYNIHFLWRIAVRYWNFLHNLSNMVQFLWSLLYLVFCLLKLQYDLDCKEQLHHNCHRCYRQSFMLNGFVVWIPLHATSPPFAITHTTTAL